MQNEFGGTWTQDKIDILVKYARAYLIIMNKMREKYPQWQLLYFDGFAGSGLIGGKKDDEKTRKAIIGAALRIVQLYEPRPFDMYYFVEMDPEKCKALKNAMSTLPQRNKVNIATFDCNEKMIRLAEWLSRPKNKHFKTLAYIDPFGMQLNWSSINAISKHSVDVWILVPTGIGANRILPKNYDKLVAGWKERLSSFLGMDEQEIVEYFYSRSTEQTLFGEIEVVTKQEKAIERCAELYAKRLGQIFEYVSDRLALKNSAGFTMFHYLMVSNNKTAVNIANDIIKTYTTKQNGSIINRVDGNDMEPDHGLF
jgi:three-Cys-motif partner protein